MASPLRNQPAPDDQRNVIIATILVAVIMFGWMFWFSPQPQPSPQASGPTDTTQQAEQAETSDTTSPDEASSAEETPSSEEDPAPSEAQQADAPTPPDADSVTAAALDGTAREIVVESDLYTAVLSTKGGTLGLSFRTPTGTQVDTRSLYFSADTDADTVRVTDESTTLTFEASLGDGALRQSYTFHPDDYDLGLSIQQVNPASFATDAGYSITWHGGMPYSEGGEEDELQ